MSLDRVTLICLFVAALGMAAAGAAVLSPASRPPALRPAAPPAAPAVDRAALTGIFTRLTPAPAPAPAIETDRIALRLIGLVHSDEGRLAVLTDGARTYTVRAGETVLGYEVLTLDAASVGLQAQDRVITLQLGGN